MKRRNTVALYVLCGLVIISLMVMFVVYCSAEIPGWFSRGVPVHIIIIATVLFLSFLSYLICGIRMLQR